MKNNNIKSLILCLILLVSSNVFAQTGLSFGTSVVKGFNKSTEENSNGVLGGIHIGLEVPKDEEVSFFGRLTVTPFSYSQKLTPLFLSPKVPDTVNFGIEVPWKTGYNCVNLEGGTRYYLGNSFDYGFSAYGGSMFMLTINTIKTRISDFDRDIYELPALYETTGRFISLNLGISGGLKNSFSFGVLYADATIAYALVTVPNSNDAITLGGSRFSNLNFMLNIGFRKDLY